MPLHLMPTTRVLLALLPPVCGCGIFAIADAIGPRSFEIGSGPALLTALIADRGFAAARARCASLAGPLSDPNRDSRGT